MSDYSVRAELSAVDKGFTSTVSRAIGLLGKIGNGAQKVTSGTAGMMKSFIGAQVVTGAFSNAVGAVSSGINTLVGELSSSTKAWSVFEGNMKMMGASASEISSAKEEMKDFAAKTIYSASEMASTYSQLSAVGTKETAKLVKGFGGLAAATDNPKQAMKTLSQQGVQMASRPKVAWQDFKLMLEQTPAGMAKVAEAMGMTSAEMVQAVQDGKIKTEDFFEAVKKVGTSKAFTEMATTFKDVGQAIGGATESLSNKLLPAFEHLNQFGIKTVEALMAKLEGINFDGLADKVKGVLDGIDINGVMDKVASGVSALVDFIGVAVSKVQAFWEAFRNTGAVDSVIQAFSSVKAAVVNVVSALTETGFLQGIADVLGQIVKIGAEVAKSIADFVRGLDPGVVQGFAKALVSLALGAKVGALGFKAFNFLKLFNPFGAFGNKATEALGNVTANARRSKGILSQIFNGIGTVLKSVGTSISTTFNGIGTAVRSVLQGVSTVIKSTGQAISTMAQGIGTGLANAFRGLGMAIAIVPPPTWLALGTAILMVGAALALVGTQGAGIAQILNGIGQVVATVLEAIATGLATVLPVLAEGISTVLSGLVSVIDALSAAIQAILPVLGVFAQQVAVAMGVVIEAIGSAIATILGALGPFIESFANGLATVITAIGTFANQVATALATVLSAISSVFAQILTAVGTFVNQIATAFSTVITAIGTFAQQVATAFGTVITAFATGASKILEGIGKLAESVGTAFAKVIEAFAKVLEQVGPILQGLASVVQATGDAIKTALEGVSGVIKSLGELIKNALDGVANIFKEMGEAALKAGEGFSRFADGIKILVDLNLLDLGATLGVTADGVRKITSLNGEMSQAGTSSQEMASGMAAVLTASSGMSGVASLLTLLGSSLSTLLSKLTPMGVALLEFASSMTTAMASVGDSASSVVTLTTAMSSLQSVVSAFNAVTSSVASNVSLLSSALNTLQTGMISLAAIPNTVASAFQVMGTTITVSVQTMTILVQTAFQTMGNTVKTTVLSAMSSVQTNVSDTMVSVGSDVSSGMQKVGQMVQSTMQHVQSYVSSSMSSVTSAVSSAMHSVASVVSSTMSSVVSTVQSAMNSAASGAYSAGYNTGMGFYNGLASTAGSIYSLASSIAANVVATIQSALNIHSPSRVMRKMGQFTGEGFAIGLQDFVSPVGEVANDLASASVPDLSYNALDLTVASRYTSGYAHENRGTDSVKVAQPLELTLSLGGNDWRLFVEDITEEQNKRARLARI